METGLAGNPRRSAASVDPMRRPAASSTGDSLKPARRRRGEADSCGEWLPPAAVFGCRSGIKVNDGWTIRRDFLSNQKIFLRFQLVKVYLNTNDHYIESNVGAVWRRETQLPVERHAMIHWAELHSHSFSFKGRSYNAANVTEALGGAKIQGLCLTMKKIILAAAALSLATVAFAPVAASAAPVRDRTSVGMVMVKHGPHCTVVKKRARVHGHWVVSKRRICR